MTRPPDSSASPDGTPVSARIRSRIELAKRRFHANDNISEFLELGDIEALHDEVTAKLETPKSSRTCAYSNGKVYLGVPKSKDTEGPEIRVYDAK